MNNPSRKKRVVVFVAGLGSGGAERVAVRICDWLHDTGHEVCLLTLSGTGTDFYSCPTEVLRLGLDLQHPSGSPVRAITANLRRFWAVRRAVRSFSADVVLALGDRSNILMLLATAGLRCRKIISERSDPELEPLSPSWALLRRLAYPMASLHVSQSIRVSRWLSAKFPRLPSVVIGNTHGLKTLATGSSGLQSRLEGFSSFFELIAVGRLSREKGVDLLLHALSKIHATCSRPVRLTLVGDGEDRAALELLTQRLGLSDQVVFAGRVSNVEDWLRRSDVYLLPSRWEGFPNAMIEAMAAGLPVIAARCKGGVEDLLGDELDRYALEFPPGDVYALVKCIEQLVNDASLRDRLAQSSLQRAAEYSPARIAAAWSAVVEAE